MLETTPFPDDDATGRLIRRAQLGDEEAWSELHKIYHPIVAVVAQAAMPDHLRGRFDPEDVVQSAFLSAFEALKRYEYQSEPTFAAWLKGIARNEMTSRVRKHDASKRAAGREVSGKDHTGMPDEGEDGESPSQVVMRRQNRTMALQALQCLPHDEQALIYMRNFEQRTWEDMADITKISVSQIRRRHERALQALIRLLP